GTEMWSITFKSPDTGFFPAPASRVILAAVRGKTGFQLHCVTVGEGSVRWRRQQDAGGRQGLPYILSSGDDAWLLHETASRLSMVDGRDLWLRDDLAVPPDGPPPVLDGDDLLLFDVKGQLVRVAAGTGETRWAIRMPDGFQPSAISPGGRIVFVRGLEAGSGAGGHLLLALSRADGSRLWSFAAPEPVMSNIVQREGRVYFGTTSSLIALDAGSGDRVFQSRATGAGWLYPVKLRDYPDRIVYTSEFTAAGFDPSSGKRLFSHGVSPVSSEADLAALDAAIPRLKGEVEKLGKEKTDFGSSYAFGQMTHFQSQADYYRMRGDRGMEAKYRSDADFQRSFFLYFGTAEVIVDIGRILEMRSIEASIDRQMLFRSSILRSCSLGEIGDYVVRADRKWVSEADDFIGVTVVHLPTGKAGFTVLSPAYMSYGLWNLVDFERKVVLHHGIGLNPSDYEYSNAREIFPYGKVRTINTYLIAWPITLPR
ncbi:MAG: PQQ-binding-like beta-propeller repeat protein, partial [bacterium]